MFQNNRLITILVNVRKFCGKVLDVDNLIKYSDTNTVCPPIL